MIVDAADYFAMIREVVRRLAEAMVARLREPDGPEIVVVNPHTAQGWLEEKAVGTARARLLRLVRDADLYERFHLYIPVSVGGTHISIHAKVVLMDNRLLRVGSSNMNNRFMGSDTNATSRYAIFSIKISDNSAPGLGKWIVALRNDLLAEHLGCANAEVEAAIGEAGSLVRTVDRLRGDGCSLVPFEAP